MPEDLGGGGLSYYGQVLIHEEVYRSGSFLAKRGGVLPSVEGPTPIFNVASDDIKKRYLEPLMNAEKEMCFALTEPEAGSDATQIRTRAEQKDGTFIINGRKHFITHGAEADFAVVFAVTDSEKKARGGITAFVVEKGTPGFEVTRLQHTASTVDRPAELTFDNVEVSADNVVGEIGNGFYAAMQWINGGRLHIAASALGIASYLVDKMLDYAKTRVAFGQPIGKNQYVQGYVVDSWCELEASRQVDGDRDGRARRRSRDPGLRRQWVHDRDGDRGVLARGARAAPVRRDQRDPSNEHRQDTRAIEVSFRPVSLRRKRLSLKGYVEPSSNRAVTAQEEDG